MITADKLRRVEIANENGVFVEASFGQIEVGDTFRLFEPDGTPVTDILGRVDRVADSNARVNCLDTTVYAKPNDVLRRDVTDGQPG